MYIGKIGCIILFSLRINIPTSTIYTIKLVTVYVYAAGKFITLNRRDFDLDNITTTFCFYSRYGKMMQKIAPVKSIYA